MRTVLLSMILLLCAGFASAQVPVTPAPVIHQQFFSAAGVPLAGGRLYSYASGSNTLLPTYRDSTGTGTNTDPLILDSTGSANIWLAGLSYKFVMQDFAGNQLWSADNVSDVAFINGLNAVLLTGNQTVAGNKTFTGKNTHTGTETFSGLLQCNDFENILCIDSLNSQGWAGSDLGAWINAAAASLGGPGHIMVTPGVYTFTTTVTGFSGQQFLCSGEGACIVNGTGLSATNHFFSFTSLSDVRVSGFNFNGPTAAGATGGTGLDVRGVSCTGCTRLEVDHNYFTSVSYGIAASPDTDGNFHDNWMNNIGLSGVSNGTSLNTQIRNNRINNVGTSNQNHGIYLQNGDGVLAQGNHISTVQGYCVVVQENVAGLALSNFSILDNYCKNGGQSASGSRGGILVATLAPGTIQTQGVVVAHNIIDSPGGGNPITVSASGNISVDDNIIRNYQNDGILISGSGAFNTEAITVTHNKLYNQTVAGNGIRALVGGATTRNITIADNILDGVFGSCIWVTGILDSKIHDNRCKDWNIGASAGNAGVLVNSAALRTQIQNNSLSSANCTGSPAAIQIVDAPSTDTQISGNTFINACAGISDAGTRSQVFGNKSDSSSSDSTGTGFLVNQTSPTLTTATLNGVTNGTGLQLFSTATTCTTAASIGATCSTANITFPVAFADTNYRVVCTGFTPTNVPIVESYSKISATQFTIVVAALTAAAASFGGFDCMAGHN